MDAFEAAYARLSVHEFLLEVVFANWLGGLTDEQASDTLAELVERTRSAAYLAQGSDPSDGDLAVQAEAVRIIERFAEKVRARRADLAGR